MTEEEELLLAFRTGVEVTIGQDRLTMVDDHIQSVVPLQEPGVLAAFTQLAERPLSEDTLFETVMEVGDSSSAFVLPALLRRLESGGWLRMVFQDGSGRELVALEPRGHVLSPITRHVVASSALVLSSRAIVRSVGERLLAESQLTSWDLVVSEPSWVATLLQFTQTMTPTELAEATGTDTATLVTVCDLAVASGLLVFADDRVDQAPELQMWSLPDLWFHTMSRVGSSRGGYGGTFRFEGEIPPEPAVRPALGELLALPEVDLTTVGVHDPALGEVVRSRRSTRVHNDQAPIGQEELSELLARVAAVKEVTFDGHEEVSFRQLPSGGALHELEIYPLVHHCAGLEPGLYHYHAGDHGLELVCPADAKTKLLLEYAQRMSVMESSPQVTLLLAARFNRAMWKYESMAYSLVLKHVGVMYEALYLTCAAMGLAGVALGGGNSAAFAAASGLSMYQEGTVGEFVVGSLPASEPIVASAS